MKNTQKILFIYFGSGSYHLILVGLDLTVWTRPALNSQRPTCLCLPGAGTESRPHHTRLNTFISLKVRQKRKMDKTDAAKQ